MINLYKELIIDHSKNPRNKKVLNIYTHSAKGFNHLCGDTYILYVNLVNNLILDISFEGNGCSISMASASIMTLELKNKNLDFAFNIACYFFDIIKGTKKEIPKLDNLNIFFNIKKFPSRIKCASLIWHTFKDALNFNNLQQEI